MYVYNKIETDYIKKNNKKIIAKLKKSELIAKTDVVLDFGCGGGIWNSNKDKEDIFFQKLYLYDINPINIEHCKKKYYNHQILNNLENDLQVNVIFANSVFQYIEINDLEKLLEKFSSILKKNGKIIISDFPKYPRIIEFILTIFCDFNLFKIQCKQVLSSSYRDTQFYKHSKNEINSISKKYFSIKRSVNIDPNKNRDTIILQKLD